MSLWPASIVCSKTKFLIVGRKGALRRAGTTASRSARIKAVGTIEPRTNSIVGIRWRSSSPLIVETDDPPRKVRVEVCGKRVAREVLAAIARRVACEGRTDDARQRTERIRALANKLSTLLA